MIPGRFSWIFMVPGRFFHGSRMVFMVPGHFNCFWSVFMVVHGSRLVFHG